MAITHVEQRVQGHGGDVQAALARLTEVEAALTEVEAAVAKLEAKVAKRRTQPAKPSESAAKNAVGPAPASAKGK